MKVFFVFVFVFFFFGGGGGRFALSSIYVCMAKVV